MIEIELNKKGLVVGMKGKARAGDIQKEGLIKASLKDVEVE